MANPNGNPKNLKPPFSSTNQPKNRGRKPSSIKKYIKDNNLNYNDMAALAKYVVPLNEAQLIALWGDKKQPMVIRIYAKAVIDDLRKGNIQNISQLIDRAVGKPKDVVETYDPEGAGLTKEERDARLEELLKKREDQDAADEG